MPRAAEVAVMPCCRRTSTSAVLGRVPRLQLPSRDADAILKQSPRKKPQHVNSSLLATRCKATPRTPASDSHSRVQKGADAICANASATYLLVRYLPRELNGFKVMTQMSSNEFRADNSSLKAPTAGLVFRTSKHINDWDSDADFVAWDEVVSATDEGDGWLRCEIPKHLATESPATFHEAGTSLASARSLQKARLGAEERAAKFSNDLLHKLAALPSNQRAVLPSHEIPAVDSAASTECSDEDESVERTPLKDDSSSCCSLDILDYHTAAESSCSLDILD